MSWASVELAIAFFHLSVSAPAGIFNGPRAHFGDEFDAIAYGIAGAYRTRWKLCT
jgi:hypothetical protein